MKRPDNGDLLFSLKSFAGSMLALYLASRLGLPRPFWAMMAAYVVANPLSGAVRSKALYRVGGTVLGSAATVLLVPLLVDAPELLSLALACWVGCCLYISLLDRTPRAYMFMLAGYTAALIGFPVVLNPAAMFDVALARVEEISIGILCATFVHTLVFPRSVGPVLLARVDHAIDDAQRWMRDALGASESARDRRMLAGDITELRLMSTHLPFDTSHLRWTSGTIRSLQDRLTIMVPVLSAVEDRLQALRQLGAGGLSARWRELLQEIVQWTQDERHTDRARAAQLRAAIAALTPEIGRNASWSRILRLNLATRLRALVDAHDETLALRRHMEAVLHGAQPGGAGAASSLSPHVLHRDRGMALLSAFAAAIAIAACCVFWIATGWPSGAAAPMMAAVLCCFFATQDDPVPGIWQFLKYTLFSIPISAFYLLAVLPAVHGFEMLVMAAAPVFLLLGYYAGRPATSLPAMAVIFGVAGALSLQDTGTADIASFINGMLAQIFGMVAAVVFTRLLRTVSAQWTARRLLHAGWRELAQMGAGGRAPSVMEMSARMLDRVALLTPRLALDGPQQDMSAVNALGDLRIGLNMANLRVMQPGLERNGVPLRPLMTHLSGHFRAQQVRPAPAGASVAAEPALLECIDAMLRATCAIDAAAAGVERHAALAALASLRRDLFPAAPPYAAPGGPDEEIR
jgi:uncharacterized membrane protein YccC